MLSRTEHKSLCCQYVGLFRPSSVNNVFAVGNILNSAGVTHYK